MSALKVLINGSEATAVSVFDRGLQYGDGLFETVPVSESEAIAWPRHYRRLAAGCRRLGIPFDDEAALAADIKNLCRQRRGVLKITITRGVGGRGYKPPEPCRPTRICALYPWPDYPQNRLREGVTVRVCETRLSHNPRLAGIKHLNRLEQVLARAEWSDDGIAEGLMLDPDDYVIEGTMSNFFAVRGGGLITADLSRCGVAGIMRDMIVECAESLAIPVAVGSLSMGEILAAEAAFVCNSVIGVWPVRTLCFGATRQGFSLGGISDRIVGALRQRGWLADSAC